MENKKTITKLQQKLPKITDKQKEILTYLYKFRFLNRNQIQQLLKHKHFNRTISWLNDLTKNKYIRRYYLKKFASVPAMYSLDVMGRKYFKNNPDLKDVKVSLLDRIWRECKFSMQFKQHCQFLGDIYLSLVSLTEKNKSKLHFNTRTDLYGMKYLILPIPDAYFAIEETNKITKRYFLDIFDELPPRMMLRKRVKQYFNYYSQNYWQDHNNNSFPEIIFICPDERSKNYLNKFIPKMLEEEQSLFFYLSTWDEIKYQGMSRQILHKVENPTAAD